MPFTVQAGGGGGMATHSHPLASYRTLYDKTALYYAHGTRYR